MFGFNYAELRIHVEITLHLDIMLSVLRRTLCTTCIKIFHIVIVGGVGGERVSFRKIGKYWRADATLPCSGGATERGRSDLEFPERSDDNPEIAALLRIEAEEEARLVSEIQGSTAFTDELEHDENTDWLSGRGWPHWFAHKPLHLIVAT